MRRRHLESVSSRSLSVRGSWGTAPSVFWHGAPGGTQGPLGKGGVAERWGVAYPIGIAARHGAKPATPRTHKRNAPPARRTGRHPAVTPRRRQATKNYPPPGRRTVYAFAKGPAVRRPRISQIKYINPQFVKIPYACACARARAAACALGCAREALPQKFPPQSTRKNGAVPPGSAGQKQENKKFSKKFAQIGRNLPPRLRIILVEGFATRKRPQSPQNLRFAQK